MKSISVLYRFENTIPIIGGAKFVTILIGRTTRILEETFFTSVFRCNYKTPLNFKLRYRRRGA